MHWAFHQTCHPRKGRLTLWHGSNEHRSADCQTGEMPGPHHRQRCQLLPTAHLHPHSVQPTRGLSTLHISGLVVITWKLYLHLWTSPLLCPSCYVLLSPRGVGFCFAIEEQIHPFMAYLFSGYRIKHWYDSILKMSNKMKYRQNQNTYMLFYYLFLI